MPTKIIIIEENLIIRKTLESFICRENHYNLIGSFYNATGMVKASTKIFPDLAIIGMNNDLKAMDSVLAFKKHYPDIKILILSDWLNEELLTKSLNVGANGILTPDLHYKEFCDALSNTSSGGFYLSSKATHHLVMSFQPNPDSPFTKKESEVVRHIINGNTYTEISDLMHVSKETVKTHIKNIYKKTRVNRKSELISKVRKNKFITVG